MSRHRRAVLGRATPAVIFGCIGWFSSRRLCARRSSPTRGAGALIGRSKMERSSSPPHRSACRPSCIFGGASEPVHGSSNRQHVNPSCRGNACTSSPSHRDTRHCGPRKEPCGRPARCQRLLVRSPSQLPKTGEGRSPGCRAAIRLRQQAQPCDRPPRPTRELRQRAPRRAGRLSAR